MSLESTHAPEVGALLALLDAVPQELLSLMPSSEYAAFLASLAALRTGLDSWRFGSHPAYQARIGVLPAYGRHPIEIIWTAMVTCPDQAPAMATNELAFLGDPELQADLRLDLSHAFAELANQHYKAATVLAGATIEALLFWALSAKLTALPPAIAAAHKKLSPDLKKWTLDDFLRVASQLHIVTEATFKASDAAKDFRNLIHAERAARHGRRCNQATAMSAVGALLHVIDDLDDWVARGKP
jgi:hypothetical protein